MDNNSSNKNNQQNAKRLSQSSAPKRMGTSPSRPNSGSANNQSGTNRLSSSANPPQRNQRPTTNNSSGSSLDEDDDIIKTNQSTKNTKNSKKSKNSKDEGLTEKQIAKKKRKRMLKRGCLGFFLLLFLLGAGAVFMVVGIFTRIIDEAPPLSMISVEPNIYTSIVYDRDGVEIDRFHGEENREYVTLDAISKYIQDAIVAVEDERFYTHNGIDVRGIARAGVVLARNIFLGENNPIQGASTITQQLIKNNVTNVIKNDFESKIQEQYLAVIYEKNLVEQFGSIQKSKEYILELYLNTVGFGHGYNGVQAAALGYFNKDAKDLTIAESACIAAITNNPTYYSPRTNPGNNKVRVDKILDHMLEQNMITLSQYYEAKNEDLYSKVSDGSEVLKVQGNIIHGYFEDAVFEQVQKDLQEQHDLSSAQASYLIYNGGLQIYTTKDTQIQNILEETYARDDLFPDVVYKYDVTYTVSTEDTTTGKQTHKDYRQFVRTEEDGLKFMEDTRAEIEANLSSTERIVADSYSLSTQPQSSMVVMDYTTGQIVGMAGGRGEKLVNRGFNRAMDSVRQPGSVFKVLAAYAPAIDMGYLMPGSIMIDEAIEIGNYSPKNWYGENYRGATTVRKGIEQSMNILAVKAMDMAGVDAAYKYLQNFGFTTLENDNHLATALGGVTYGVTQAEVTAAYAAIANGGKYYEPVLYTKVLDHDGNILLDTTEREPEQIIKETTAYMLTDMMEDVVTQGTGTAAKFKTLSMPIAGKTGTAQEVRDLTFVGYTPYYVAGIWFGYDRYDTVVPNMQSYIDGRRVIANDRYHLTLWQVAMEQIHTEKNLQTTTFGSRPAGIVDVSVCLDSGDLATSDCRLDPRGSRVVTDMYLQGTQPTDYCTEHKIIYVCSDSGLLPSSFCPSESRMLTVLAQYTNSNPPTTTCDIHTDLSMLDPEDSLFIPSDMEFPTEMPDDLIGTPDITIPDVNIEVTTQSQVTTESSSEVTTAFDPSISGEILQPSVGNTGVTEVTTQATTQNTEQTTQATTQTIETTTQMTTQATETTTETTTQATETTTEQVVETTTQSNEPSFGVPE